MNKILTIFQPRFSIQDQTLFVKRLAFLIKGGVPILESLNIIRKNTKSKARAKVFDSIIASVSNGQFLSTSMEEFKNHFGDFSINLIRIGETSGVLHQNLVYLAEELKKKQILKRKIMSALLYPFIITIATLAITLLLTLYIFPKIMPIFTSLNVNLPLSTRILIGTNEVLRDYGLFILSGTFFVFLAVWLCMKFLPNFRWTVNNLLLSAPLIGKMNINYNTANFCRTLGLLLKSDISIIEAIRMTASTTVNPVYRLEFESIADHLTQGDKLSQYLMKDSRIFPEISTEMISIGESTGNLPETLIYLSELHETELDDTTKNLSNSIEPILMMVMGLIVGFIAISVITPIYEITQNLRR